MVTCVLIIYELFNLPHDLLLHILANDLLFLIKSGLSNSQYLKCISNFTFNIFVVVIKLCDGTFI